MNKTLQTFHDSLISEQANIAAKLEVLKNNGKEKTVSYRELFAQKFIIKAIIEKLEMYLKS